MLKISVIIPVNHEEKYINSCIRFLIKRLKNSIYEIIVVDSSKNQTTLKKIKDFPVKIKKINSFNKTRGYNLNLGAKYAEGEILLFIHVDTILPKNAYDLIKNNIKENLILSFSLGFYDKKLFFKIIEFFGKIRCFFTNVPYGDQCFVMKRETFFKIGKFPEKNLEDVRFIETAKKKSIRVKILNEKVKTSPRKWYKNGFFKTTFQHRIIIFKYLLERFTID